MGSVYVLATSPRLYVVEGFAGTATIEHILRAARDEAALARRGIQTDQNETGFSFEMPVDGDPVLEDLTRRTYDLLGLDNDFGGTLRFRRYRAGNYHPPHHDIFQIGDAWLIATALLYLTDTEDGGATHFPEARPGPIRVRPRRGRLAVWYNHLPDGAVDPAALHEGLAIEAGEKATLANFIYKPLPFAATDPLNPVARPHVPR